MTDRQTNKQKDKEEEEKRRRKKKKSWTDFLILLNLASSCNRRVCVITKANYNRQRVFPRLA